MNLSDREITKNMSEFDSGDGGNDKGLVVECNITGRGQLNTYLIIPPPFFPRNI